MSNLVASLLVLVFCLMAAATAEFKYCDEKVDYPVKVIQMNVSPYPAKRSALTSFKATATTAEVISRGTVEIDVAYFGQNIHNESRDLCEVTSCPIAIGDFEIYSDSLVIPMFAPTGLYPTTLKIYDAKKHQLTCVIYDLNIPYNVEDI